MFIDVLQNEWILILILFFFFLYLRIDIPTLRKNRNEKLRDNFCILFLNFNFIKICVRSNVSIFPCRIRGSLIKFWLVKKCEWWKWSKQNLDCKLQKQAMAGRWPVERFRDVLLPRIKCNLVGVRRLLPLPTLLLQATALRNLIGFIDRFSDSHFPSGLLSAVCVQSMSQPMSFSSFKRSWTSRIFIHDVIRCFYGYGFFVR